MCYNKITNISSHQIINLTTFNSLYYKFKNPKTTFSAYKNPKIMLKIPTKQPPSLFQNPNHINPQLTFHPNPNPSLSKKKPETLKPFS